MSPKVFIKNLGCKANASDAFAMESALMGNGFESTSDERVADLIIINSCTVTDEADRQSQRWVKTMRKRNPNSKIVYTGCSAEVDPKKALSIPGVSAVIGNRDKPQAAALISKSWREGFASAPFVIGETQGYTEWRSQHPLDREWPVPDSAWDIVRTEVDAKSTHRTRVFLKIQEGCNSFCTYCIIPYGRGPSRSLSLEKLIQQIQRLTEDGTQEVVLTGTNIGEYHDGIENAIEAIVTQTNLPRLRISSLDPRECSPRLMDLIDRHPAICPHIHLSLQHTESKVLRLMKRKYSQVEVIDFFDRVNRMKRRPFVGMDLIVGFPGETAADFDQMVQLLDSVHWSRIHVFPFSEREGTPATRLPSIVPVSVRQARAKVLQEMSLNRLISAFSQRRSQFQTEAGVLSDVLVEGPVKGPSDSGDWVGGYTPDYQRVFIPRSDGQTNHVSDFRVRHWTLDRAAGEVAWIAEGKVS